MGILRKRGRGRLQRALCRRYIERLFQRIGGADFVKDVKEE
jgi:hypothetical protein